MLSTLELFITDEKNQKFWAPYAARWPVARPQGSKGKEEIKYKLNYFISKLNFCNLHSRKTETVNDDGKNISLAKSAHCYHKNNKNYLLVGIVGYEVHR